MRCICSLSNISNGSFLQTSTFLLQPRPYLTRYFHIVSRFSLSSCARKQSQRRMLLRNADRKLMYEHTYLFMTNDLFSKSLRSFTFAYDFLNKPRGLYRFSNFDKVLFRASVINYVDKDVCKHKAMCIHTKVE